MESSHVLNTTKPFSLKPFIFNLLSVDPPLVNILSKSQFHIFILKNDFSFWLWIYVQELSNIWPYLQGCLDKGTYNKLLSSKSETEVEILAENIHSHLTIQFPLYFPHSCVPLHSGRGTQHTENCAMNTERSTLLTTHRTLHTAHCTLNNIHNTLNNESRTLHTVYTELNGFGSG